MGETVTIIDPIGTEMVVAAQEMPTNRLTPLETEIIRDQISKQRWSRKTRTIIDQRTTLMIAPV